MSAPEKNVSVVEKRGSPLLVAGVGLVFLSVGLYLGGWFDWVTPKMVVQCEAQVRAVFAREADRKVLLPKCGNRHMIEGMAGGHADVLSVQQIVDNLDAGRRVDMVSMFMGGAFIGAGIAAFAAANRLRQNQRQSRGGGAEKR